MVFGLYNVANYQIISMEDNYILSKIIQHDKKRFQLGCQMPSYSWYGTGWVQQ